MSSLNKHVFLTGTVTEINGRRNSVTHALAKGITAHLGLDFAREGCVRINAHTTSIKQKLKQDYRTLRADHVSSKRS